MRQVSVQVIAPELAALFLCDALSDKADTSMGLSSVDDLLAGAECFGVIDDTTAVQGVYALRIRQCEHGAVAWVVGAAGYKNRDFFREVWPVIEMQCRDAGCAQIAIETRRPGMVKQLQVRGFEQSSVVMRKVLQ